MMGTDKESNVNGGRSYFESLVGAFNVEGVKANGGTVDTGAGSSGLGGDCLLTYKRRRTVKVERRKVSDDSVSQLSEKLMKRSDNVASCSKKDAYYSNNCSLKHKRNIILEQICQSLDSGGLKKCIQNTLAFPPGSDSGTTVKKSVRSSEDWSRSTSQAETLLDGPQSAAKSHVGLAASESVDEPNFTPFTESCSSTFSDIIMSEQFAQLCSLLLENFEGMSAVKLFDLNHINTRMNEKAYESSPMLFRTDILEVWKKLQKVGLDITALARCLSDKTMCSFHEQCPQVGQPPHSMSEDANHELPTQASDMHTRPELRKTHALDGAHTCGQCREKADGKNVLVCDSCEKMYHISCIEPAVKEIPTRSWYCANCSAKRTKSSHENCIACERLNAYMPPFDGEEELENDRITEELEESLNQLSANEGDRSFQHCTVCRTEVTVDEDYRICGHSFCPHKFYHMKCLTSQQLISHGSCWYCPSCLCRFCLANRDDDKIVLCDGCDHAYHIYCMQPPLSTVPKGKWFCQQCNSEIQHVQKARMLYENMQNAAKKRESDRKMNKAGGMDMLLSAAKTLNYEDNLAAMGSVSL